MAYQYPYSDASAALKKMVWEKGRRISQGGKSYDANVWRWDKCGRVMKYSEHGNVDSEFGWEIHHIKPTSKGGTDDMPNLQPLQWENNRRKSDQYPWSC